MVDRVRPSATKRRIMREFSINEISGVDAPAQGHAKVTLMKRAGTTTTKGHYGPSDIAAQIQALDFDAVLAEDEAREAAREIGSEIQEKWCALQRSFGTIAGDDAVAPADKVTAMQASLAQFIASLSSESDELAESMAKSLTAVPALSKLLTTKTSNLGEEPMTEAEKAQLNELTKKVATLTKSLEAATASDVAKKAADLQAELTASVAKFDELTKKFEQAESDKAAALVKAGMSDAEKSYMDGMDDKARKEFMAMSPADRQKKMKKSVDEDPVVYKSDATGQEYRKSDDARLVEMAKRADENDRLFKAEVEKRETAELAKRAAEELKDFSGSSEEKIAVLRAVGKMDEAARDSLMKMLAAGGKAISAAFETVGHDREAVQKSAQDFNKRIDEVMRDHKMGRAAAMEKARELYPEEFKAYQGKSN